MAVTDIAARAVDAAFRLRGETVTATVGGVPMEFLAIREAPSERSDFGGVPAALETVRLRLRSSEVTSGDLASAIIGPGTAMTVAGEARVVQGALEWGDPLRQTILVDTRPA